MTRLHAPATRVLHFIALILFMKTKHSPALHHDLVDCIGAVRRLWLNARLPLLDVTQDLVTDTDADIQNDTYYLYFTVTVQITCAM